jgi:SAM-dependent methyltransferase
MDIRPRLSQSIAADEMAPVHQKVLSSNIAFLDLADRLDADYHGIIGAMEQFQNTLDQIIQEIDRTIDSMEPSYYASSYQLYENMMQHDSNEHILNRRFSLKQSALDFLKARIVKQGDWHWPAMIIRPGLEDWIQDLVACDPLYLVDTNYELLNPAIERFNPDYQRRLRRYVVTEPNTDMLKDLPQDQFGFILAYNFFNYKPLEVIKFYLESAYKCLKPGGVFAFTINDCNKTGGATLAERSYMCYTPASMIKSLVTSLGYLYHQVYHIDSSNTWIEVQKPGQRHSLRAGQALAQVHAKSLKTH